MSGHVYEWLRERGYHARDAAVATHLFLDGGKARVPDEAAPAFLNAYAASLVRWPAQRPCIVERRTPVFRMFLDLDTRFLSREALARFSPCLARMSDFMDRAIGASESWQAIACAASEPRVEAGAAAGSPPVIKSGFHVVWPAVLVTQATALELRRLLVASAQEAYPDPATLGLANAWDAIVDASVFRANGLRMPWSAKGRDDPRFYEPRWELHRGQATEVGPLDTLSSVRDMVHRLSIRAFGTDPTVSLESGSAEDSRAAAERSDKPAARCANLTEYAAVLPALAAALPVQYAGQRFTGMSTGASGGGPEAPSFFSFRSTARYCFNLGRAHRTNTVYFVLTRRGVSQRCFCRCDTTEGRRFGLCEDFVSQTWPVPEEVTRAFFGSDGTTDPPPLPSQAAKSFLDIDALAARSRPAVKRPAPKRPASAAKRPRNELNVLAFTR